MNILSKYVVPVEANVDLGFCNREFVGKNEKGLVVAEKGRKRSFINRRRTNQKVLDIRPCLIDSIQIVLEMDRILLVSALNAMNEGMPKDVWSGSRIDPFQWDFNEMISDHLSNEMLCCCCCF